MKNPIKAARTGVLTYVHDKSGQLLTTTRKERKAAKRQQRNQRRYEKLERKLNCLEIKMQGAQ